MRIKICFESIDREKIILPLHYNYLIQSFIYKNIDKNLAKFLHDEGFEYGKRKFKMFVFSRIFSDKYKVSKENIIFNKKIYFYLSSPLKEFISQFAENLLKKSEFKFFGNKICVREIFVLPEIDFEDKIKINMISPLTVYSTLYGGGKKKTYYYSPFEKEFEILVKGNLKKKFESFYKREIDFSFKIKPINVNKNHEKIIIYKGTVIKGWLGKYEIESSSEMIKFAYDTGLGSKNSQGFGMFEICI